MQIGVVETDLIDPDSAPAFDSLHQQPEGFLYVFVKFLDLFRRKLARVPACQRNSSQAKPTYGVPTEMLENGGMFCVKAGEPTRGATRAKPEIAVHGRQEFVLLMSLTPKNNSFSCTVEVPSRLSRQTTKDQSLSDVTPKPEVRVIFRGELFEWFQARTAERLQLVAVREGDTPRLSFGSKALKHVHSPTVTVCHFDKA
jgi:hypothetical protein